MNLIGGPLLPSRPNLFSVQQPVLSSQKMSRTTWTLGLKFSLFCPSGGLFVDLTVGKCPARVTGLTLKEK